MKGYLSIGKVSKRKNHYLLLKDDGLEISFFEPYRNNAVLMICLIFNTIGEKQKC